MHAKLPDGNLDAPLRLQMKLAVSGTRASMLAQVAFDGVRVPARLAMVAALMLAVLAGMGAAWLLSRGKAGHNVNTRAALTHVGHVVSWIE